MLLDQGAKVVLLGNLGAVDAHDAVTGLQTGLVGGAALHNIHNVNAVGSDVELCGGLGIGHSQIGDAHVGAAGDIAVLQQILCHLDGIVDGDGKAQTLRIAGGGLCVDQTDELTVHVEQAAAGVAGADRGIHLDQGHGVGGAGALDGHAAVQGADDAAGHGAAQLTQRVAHGQHALAHGKAVAVANGGGGQVGGIDLEDSHIAGVILAHHGGGVIGIADGHGDVGCAGHNVRTGQDIAVGADHDTTACAALHLALAVPGPLGVDHLLGGDDHHAGADHLGHLRRGHAAGHRGAIRGGIDGIRSRAAVRTFHLLDDDLVAAIAELRACKAAHKAHGRRKHQRHRALSQLAVVFLLLFGLPRGRGVLFWACRGRGDAAVAGILPGSSVLRVGGIRLAISSGGVCGVHAAGTHIGVASLTGSVL